MIEIKDNLIFFDEMIIPFIVKRHHKAKRLTMRFKNHPTLLITAPFGANKRAILDFLYRNEIWIQKNYNHLKLHMEQSVLYYGGRFPYLGKFYTLVSRFEQKRNFIFCPLEEAFFFACSEKMIGFYLKKFLKQEAEHYITPLAKIYSQKLGVHFTKICYKDTKTRWGSCNSLGHLCFSWRIMMAAPEIVHYLVAHEVAHLVELNHSSTFWSLCEKLCPEMVQHRSWLKQYGKSLQFYSF